MESRVLLSAYTLQELARFGGNTTGTAPQSTLIADPNGNLYGTASAGGAFGAGTVFEIAKGSSTITALASFDGSNGANPAAGLTPDAFGNLFGAAGFGGANGYGTVFEMASGTNAITAIASFNSSTGSAGSVPDGVAFDSTGNLFGVTSNGGPNGDGTVYEIAKGTNAITNLASFNGADGNTPWGGVTVDSVGNLYGVTAKGGADNDGTVFEIANGSNTITTLVAFNGSNGQGAGGALTLDPSGNLYGTTASGGTNGGGTVFEIIGGSLAMTTLANFNVATSSGPAGALTLDEARNIYGTTSGGGTYGHGTVFKIAAGSNAITTMASFNGTNGQGPYAGVTLDAAGNLFGTSLHGGSFGNGTLFEIAHGSATITAVASFDPLGGTDPLASVTLDASGNLYGTTQWGGAFDNGTVFEIPRGSIGITTLASFAGPAYGPNGSEPQAAVTLDSFGNLYGTTNQGGAAGFGSVFEIAKGSNAITTLASFDIISGWGAKSTLTLDSAGNIYGTTSMGGTGGDGMVYEIPKGSGVMTTLGTFNFNNGGEPSSVTLDAAGNLYGTTAQGGSQLDGTVFEIAHGTNTATTLVTFNGTNGASANGLVIDAFGDIYGTTQYGGAGGYGTIFKIASGSNTLTTLATFNPNVGEYPETCPTLDAAGNLYGTTRSGGNASDGTVFKLAKGTTAITAIAAFNGQNGVRPYGVALDAYGNLFGLTILGGGNGAGTVFELSANTAVTLARTSGSNPADPTQPLTFTAIVTGGVPDGETVTLIDASNNNAVLATGTLSGGSATLTVPAGTLSVGTHNLIAVYAGDANFAASESAAYAQVVQATPPALVGAPEINGDNPNGLYAAPSQPANGVQRSMVEDIVYRFSEPVVINDANAAFTLALAGQMTGTLPSTLYATAVPGSNGTQWAVSLTGQAVGTFGSIANGEYSITINPTAVFAAADGTTPMTTGETDTFYRLFGDLGGDRVVNAQDIGKMKTALSVYNPALDANWDGTDSALDVGRLKSSLSISYANDGFVTTI